MVTHKPKTGKSAVQDLADSVNAGAVIDPEEPTTNDNAFTLKTELPENQIIEPLSKIRGMFQGLSLGITPVNKKEKNGDKTPDMTKPYYMWMTDGKAFLSIQMNNVAELFNWLKTHAKELEEFLRDYEAKQSHLKSRFA